MGFRPKHLGSPDGPGIPPAASLTSRHGAPGGQVVPVHNQAGDHRACRSFNRGRGEVTDLEFGTSGTVP